MRERSIVWDIMVAGLLFVLVITNIVALMQNNNLEKSSRLYAQALNEMKQALRDIQARGVAVNTNGNANPETVKTDKGKHSKSYNDGSKNPVFKRGDENADDGDTLVINEVDEPNSLNPLIDNDATGHDLFRLCNDYLVERAFDDLKTWEPKLAKAWEKAMICRAIVPKKDAAALAEKLNKELSAEQKDKLMISRISAEKDDVLRIDLEDATNIYRESVMKILGEGAVARQHWVYVSYEGTKFKDGTAIDGKAVSKLVHEAIDSATGGKGQFGPDWEREGSVVVIYLGDGDAANKAVKNLIDSPKNMGEVVDAKSTSGKSERKVLTFDLMEHYDFEEKPIFTYYLREGVRWSDGEKLDGRDVVFSFNAMKDPRIEGGSQRQLFVNSESCELVDNNPMIVRYTWKKPDFLAFTNSCELYIFPEHIFKYNNPDEFNKSPHNQRIVGNGPYRMESWQRKSQLTLVRNESYYGKKPHFTHINALFVADPTVSFQMLKAGQLDIHGMTKSQAKKSLDDPDFLKKFKTELSVGNQYTYIGWNMRKPMFDSLKTRQALTMLTDRKRIVETYMRGYALVLDIPTHPDSPVYPKNPERFHIPFDVDAAKKLLAEDGWKDTDGDNILDKELAGKRTPFKFNLLIPSGSEELLNIASLMKDTYAQAGVQVNVSPLEWSVLIQNIERLNFDAVISGWRVGLDDDPYQLFHSSQVIEKASNHCGYINKEVDMWIEQGRCELDDARRAELFGKVYETVARELPYTNLFVPKRTIAYVPRIENVVYNLKGKELTRWWVRKEMQKVK